jgi:phosphonate transport system substrate-binding protein
MGDQSSQNQAPRRPVPPASDSGRLRAAKIILGVILAIGVSFALYHVIKVTYLDRRVSRFLPRGWVNLDGKDAPQISSATKETSNKLQFRVAIAPIVSPERSMEMYQGFVDYVANKMDRNPVPTYQPTYSETNDMVRYRRCDIGIVCTYPFIRGEKEFGMQALVVPQVNGETTYRCIIIVPRSSPAKTIMDLRGKRFASADVISTTGWLYPAILLMEKGENPNHFFGEHILTHSHDRSLQAVAEGFVDGAAVHGLVYNRMLMENPSILDKVRVLAKSPPFGIPPIVVNPDVDPHIRDEARTILLNMHNDEQGKKILETLQIEKFVIPQKGLFDSLREEVNRLERWK